MHHKIDGERSYNKKSRSKKKFIGIEMENIIKNIILTSTDAEIEVIINAINAYWIYLDKEFIKVGCHNIVAYYNKTHKSRLVQWRWYRLVDYITGNGYKQQSQHIKGKDNKIADYLCRELIKPMRNNIILEVIQQFIMKNFGYNIFTFKATEQNKINYLHF